MDAPTHVTCFLRHRGEVLLRRRDDGPFSGPRDAITRAIDGDPDATAEAIVDDAIDGDVALVRRGRDVPLDGDRVRPSLFDCAERRVALADAEDVEWRSPTVLLDDAANRGLWTAYERVAPSVGSVAADSEHGSAYLSLRALEVLRDRAALLAGHDADPAEAWDELSDLARRLRTARPDMAALANRVDRVMFDADKTADGVERAAIAGVERAVAADDGAAERAAALVDGKVVLTLSRSGTVLDALRTGAPSSVVIAESRPAREGVDVAEAIADAVPVTLTTDAAVAAVLAERDVDRVLVGADAVLPDGSVVNKTGTRTIALAAAYEDVPVYAAAATDKVRTDRSASLETGDRSAVYDGEAPVDVFNPTFDVTPPDRIDGIVTERGVRSPDEIEPVAEELRRIADWS